MNHELHALKAQLNFTTLVAETHAPDRSGRVLCPTHDDHHPSCHIYSDHWHCFACGAHGDALDWLKWVHGLSVAEAIRELERRAHGFVPTILPKRTAAPKRREAAFKPVSKDALVRHRLLASKLVTVPAALEGRGLDISDLVALGVAAIGEDAVLPVPGPNGRVVALKRRYAVPKGARYAYVTKGCGTPAWCSPNILEAAKILTCEGELNAVACSLARPDLGVQGIAGANGQPYLDTLAGKAVYVYADDDEPGHKARERWARQALEAGAKQVYILEPWLIDACDVAGRKGRAALRETLNRSLESATSFIPTPFITPILSRLARPQSYRSRQISRWRGFGHART